MRDLLAPDFAEAKSTRNSSERRIGVGIACFIEQSAHGTPDFRASASSATPMSSRRAIWRTGGVTRSGLKWRVICYTAEARRT
jgi:hypothetical protein